MAFIVSKKSTRYGKERSLYYLVENYREGNKIKRKTLLPLGKCKTVSELLASIEEKEAAIVERLEKKRQIIDELVKTGKSSSIVIWPTDTAKTIKTRLIKQLEKARIELNECQSMKEEIKKYI